jgi:hypothetical protein
MRVLEPKEIAQLLRAEVKKAGSQGVWAKRAGVQRADVNKVIHQKRPASKKMIKALGLRIVVVKDRDAPSPLPRPADDARGQGTANGCKTRVSAPGPSAS